MINEMKKLLIKLFEPRFLLRLPTSIKYRVNRILHEKLLFKLASKESVFASIWRNNYWGSGESLSGPGSTLEQTANLRQKMPVMFDEMDIKSVFDAPCGDMHWMQYVLKDAKFTYLGGDIVGELVSVNKKKFANTEVNFIKFDMTTDVFPVADVWLCRAVFFHLSNRDIYLALEQFVDSNIKYMLTTNCVTGEQHINKDIVTGDWRSLNLNLPPFNFPRESLWEVEDYAPPHPPTTLTLWTKAQVETILPSLRKIYKQ
jgi:hypothetical protein